MSTKITAKASLLCDMHMGGFSLAELLIALLILSVIATFTIPKVLVAQQNSTWRAAGKEAIATIAGAYSAYQMSNIPSATMGTSDLVPYLNYVRLDTTSLIDHITGQSSLSCSIAVPGCLVLHNGGYLFPGGSTFGQTNRTNYIHYHFDPDGKYSGSTTGSGKSMDVILYFNGRVSTSAERQTTDTTYIGGTPYNWGADTQASWFSW